jgi:hypothetical protein
MKTKLHNSQVKVEVKHIKMHNGNEILYEILIPFFLVYIEFWI